MIPRQRIRAESSFLDYRDRERLRSAERIGILGKQDGTLDVSSRTGFVYVRLDSDPRKLIMAMCPNSIQRVADLPVAVRRVWTAGAPSWTITGRSPIPVYSTDPMSGTVASHASQHQRGDLGTGGFDPLDVYDRMLLQTRIQAQATPNMTVYLTPGPYLVGGTWHLTAGGSSAAFVAPSNHRCDLVYIKSDLSLTILQGVDGASPGTRPSVPDNCCPLAYVWLDSTTTSITETCIEDARLIAGQTFSTTVHDILSDTHTDALAASPQVDDLIYANLSPAWARLAKGGDGDVLTVVAATHHVAWASPQCVTVLTHDHSGDSADGGTFDAANLTSDSASDGYVLTADGAGNAAWESVVSGSITVKEQDGNPSVSNVSEIRVTNGTLTNEGAGAVSIDTGGGGGGYTEGARVYNSAAISVANNAWQALTFDSERYDTDNCHYTSAANLTGTVDKAATSATLTGHGTAFLSELSVGQMITVPGTANEVRVVTAIAADDSLTVNAAYANTANGQTATRVNTGLVCRTAGTYLIIGNCIGWAVSASGIRGERILLNGTTELEDVVLAYNTGGVYPGVATIYQLVQWDYVELEAYQNISGGGALNLNSVGNRTPEFMMQRIG